MSHQISENTKIRVYELCKNGESLFEAFFHKIEKDKKLFDKLAGAIRIVELSSELFRLPKAKFRLIEGHKLECKVYEAKCDVIRVYLFHEENTGRIIVTGGVKGDQKKDIQSLVKTIREYYHEREGK